VPLQPRNTFRNHPCLRGLSSNIVTLEILSDPEFTRTYLDMQVFDHIV
jgi:hypothetical protein